VRATRHPALADGDEEGCMRSRYLDVVVDDWQRGDHFVQEEASGGLALARGDVDANSEFGNRYGGDGRFVVIVDELIEIESVPLDFDQYARVEQ
jgi:hypothetical protein